MDLPLAPLFPLPETILFPSQILPLHIFEPRYRQMVLDLLDGKGDMIIGTVLGDDKQMLGEVAPVQPVAGLGRLERYEELANERFMIVILGISRVHVYPSDSDHLYPLAHYEPIETSDDEIAEPLYNQLCDLVLAKEEFDGLPEKAVPTQLVDILIMTAETTVEEKYRLFAIADLGERAIQVVDSYR